MTGKKILLVTGRCAAKTLKEYSRNQGNQVEIHACNIDVAALLTPEIILEELENKNLDEISLILLPGAINADIKKIQDKLGIACARGPKNINQLRNTLKKIGAGEKLSPDIPADELFKEEMKENAWKEIKKAREKEGSHDLKIGRVNPVYLGTGLMKIVAEIPDAPHLTEKKIECISRHYSKSGADIIDIGMTAGENNPNQIKEIVDVIKSVTDKPTSIDTLNEKEIRAAADAGVDLILSIDETNYRVMEDLDIPAVIIPRNRDGIPFKTDERITLLESLTEKLKDINFSKIIADPILNPPSQGMMESLKAYRLFRERHPRTPMMLGAGNVTELMDADSIGINALLASIASELKIDLLFTTEASPKTLGVVAELSGAVEMMYLSRKYKQPPKDLGVSLLRLKEKRRSEPIKDPREESLETIETREPLEEKLEDCEFRIYVADSIVAIYYVEGKPEMRFRGRRAEDIYGTILSKNIVKDMKHAAYLGRELGKAEIALKLGRSYVQDEDFI